MTRKRCHPRTASLDLPSSAAVCGPQLPHGGRLCSGVGSLQAAVEPDRPSAPVEAAGKVLQLSSNTGTRHPRLEPGELVNAFDALLHLAPIESAPLATVFKRHTCITSQVMTKM